MYWSRRSGKKVPHRSGASGWQSRAGLVLGCRQRDGWGWCTDCTHTLRLGDGGDGQATSSRRLLLLLLLLWKQQDGLYSSHTHCWSEESTHGDTLLSRSLTLFFSKAKYKMAARASYIAALCSVRLGSTARLDEEEAGGGRTARPTRAYRWQQRSADSVVCS